MGTFIPTGGRMARVIVSLSTVITLSGVGAFLPQVAGAVTIAELEAQIAVLIAQLNALKGQPAAPAGKCSFTRSLTVGVTGDDVKCLQQYLNSTATKVASSGVGSPGSETTYFGSLTRAAVAAWQSANGVSPAVGYFGSISRAKYSSLVAGAPAPAPAPTPTPPGTPPPPTGTGLTVAAATQPGDSLAPLNAARLPATKFTVTAGSDGDVRISSITAERQGPATDAAIKDIVLLGEDNLQIGLAKTLNSNHQVILSEPITIKAGTSRTLTVALNRPSASANAESGNIAKIAVVAIDAGSAAVSGSLPIIGSPLTMNGSLSIGTFSLAKGVNDPGAGQTKEIGTKGYIFTALRGTASQEDVSVKWVSWNQSGSAAASDLKNMVVNAGGKDYPATVSSDGKYYTANFGDGISLAKGNTLEMYMKGDIESGSNRGVDFDLYRLTDIYVVGKQFGFGVTPTSPDADDSQTDDDGTFDDDVNPVWDAYEAPIGAGTITVTASTAAPAQNIGVNLNDQPLGAFDVEIKGEPVTVSSIVIRVSANINRASVTEVDFSAVALYDSETGKVVAGPLDGSGTADAQMVFTFTDAVTFPVSKKAYVLKGKLSTDFGADQLVSASTTPNTDWSSVTGQVSGTSITPANTGTVSGNSMTVKTGAVTISLASSPQAQTVIRGAKSFTFANIVFDGNSSGEDVRFTSVGVQHNYAVAADITNCQLFDGTTAHNTGTNIVNPAAASSAALKDNTFTLDTNLTIPKGTSKSIALKCDVSKSGTGAYAQWTFSSNESFGATGLTSGTSITPGVASSTATNRMAFATTGSITVTLDPGSPSVALVQSGQEATVSKLRLTATDENMELKQLSLQLSNTASNTPSDLVRLTAWDGADKVASVDATSSDQGLLLSIGSCAGCKAVTVSKDSDKILTVKAQLATIGANQAGRPGHLVTVDFDQISQGGNSTTYAVGSQSTSNVYVASADTAAAGVRTVRAYPTLGVLSVPSTSLADATQKVLYRFSVAAPAGTNGISLYKFTFNVATNGDDSGFNDVTISNLRLYGFANSNFTGGKYTADGQLNNGSLLNASDGQLDGTTGTKATATDYQIYFNPADPTDTAVTAAEAITVSAGETVYFELRGDISGADAGDSASVQLMGDNYWFGIANTSGGTIGYDDDGFLAGALAFGFATSAPYVDSYNHQTSAGNAVTGAGKNVGATGGNTAETAPGADFVWSGNSTTTHSGEIGAMGPDWHNGFLVPGLPSTGGTAITFTL